MAASWTKTKSHCASKHLMKPMAAEWYKDKGAYHLYLLATEAPIARLKPTGEDDEVRIAYWSHRRKWEDIDNMGGCVLPLDQALSQIATSSLFWTWT